jgi:uncharacterized protein YjbI with pentapeptide repeats
MRTESALEKLRDASGEARRAFLWFGTFGAYFVTTVASTTHEALLRGTAVKLPLLAVDLPIVGFYVVAPFLFVLLHLYLMFQLVLLGGRARDLIAATGPVEAREIGPSFPVTQYLLAGLGGFRPVFAVSIWIAVIMLPLLGLLFVQIRFLPYHSYGISYLHQILVVLDAVVVALLWWLAVERLHRSRRALVDRPRSSAGRVGRKVTAAGGYAGLILFALGIVLFATRIAIIPPERAAEVILPTDEKGQPIDPCDARAALPPLPQPGSIPASMQPGVGGFCTSLWQFTDYARSVLPAPRFAGGPQRRMSCLTYLLFEAPTTPLDMRRNLVVRGASFAVAPDEPGVGGGFDLRGRDLRFADFTASNLTRADLRGADLYGADLRQARLVRADLGDVPQTEFDRCGGFESRGGEARPYCRTVVRQAGLDGASMAGARLRKADVRGASLQGAVLSGADLVEADLSDADTTRADMSTAELRGAHLDRVAASELRATGADLTCSWAEGANLAAADLSVASASRTRLAGAGLTEARLVGTYLARSDLRGARLAGAYLEGVDLRAANLLGVSWATEGLAAARLTAVDLRGALVGPDVPPNPGGLATDSAVPTAPAPAAYDAGLVQLLTPLLERPDYRSGVVQRIESDWHDVCTPRSYRAQLADALLAGACERDGRFTGAEWWVLQIARRAAGDPGRTGSSAPGVGAGRCVTGPPPSPKPCVAETGPWQPVSDNVPGPS